MAWIQTIEEDQASGKLKKIYESLKKERGKVSRILSVHSLHPRAMQKHLELYAAVMFDSSGVSREEREMIACIVSRKNRCPYCIAHHDEALFYYWKDREKIRSLENIDSCDITDRQKAMLHYAEKLTESPEKTTEKEIKALRNHGFSDEEILTVNLVVSYFNFVNRIALGLGVEADDDEVSGYNY